MLDKKRIFFIGMAVLIVVSSLALGEIFLRIYFYASSNRPIYLPDPNLGYVHIKDNCFKFGFNAEEGKVFVPHCTNSLGLIGEDIQITKSDHIKRILVLGDSFAEALQVLSSENFAAKLQEALNTGKEKQFEVLNAGMSGFSPISMYLYFKREMIKLDPDLVIVQLFANDVFEDQKVKAMSVLDGQGFPVHLSPYFVTENQRYTQLTKDDEPKLSLTERITKVLMSKSRLMEYFYIKQTKALKKSRINREKTSLDRYTDGHQFFIIRSEDQLFQDKKFREQSWENTSFYLRALKDLILTSGADVMFMYIPMEAQLSLPVYGRHTQMFSSTQLNTYFNDRLKEFCQEENIPFLDLLAAFEENKDKELYLNDDGHLTKQGHEVAARALFNFVSDNNYPKEKTFVSLSN